MAIFIQQQRQNKRHKTKSIGSPDPMDAFLGLYDNGSDSDDDEWISQLELGDPLASNSSQKKNLPPEPQSGNIEYKLKLVNPSEQRIQHLVTQMKWRLREGQGEAIYEIGVGDDGFLHGLSRTDMDASLDTLGTMARRLGASVTVLRRRSLDATDNEANADLSVAEVLVRKVPDDQRSIDLRVAVLGNVEVGKSTLIGVLTQGQLDNGRGLARLNMFRHKHEFQTGRTSSVSHDILGFDSSGQIVNYEQATTAEEICDNCSKLLTFIDLAGHHKYLRTTIRGLTSYSPHYVMLIVSGTSGVVGTTREHLGLALALEVPFFIVVTKQDVTRPPVLADTIQHLETHLKGPGCNKVPFRIESEDDVITAGAASLSEKTVPIFVVSSVTGRGLNLLTKFLHLLPPGWGALEREKMEQEPVEFQIYETFCLPQVGTVLGGLLTQGVLTENMNLLLGPLEDGSFHPVQVQSIQRYKSSCRVVRAGQSASLALNIELPNIRKGMILADPHLNPQATLYFQATIVVLFHSTSMHKGFQTTVHIGSIQQTAVLEGIMAQKHISTNDTASVLFRFLQHPEFIRTGSRLLFRTGSTQGIGKITQVFPIEIDSCVEK
uniref:Tr-type G domain-containing protein n=1 Tax=Daphnia galeata TaxID=27404 RepID=A0A8J2S267_9CRUS|nr:unnamed protein product [Daphnia galeata]